MNRALETQKAKKELKEECKNIPGAKWKNGKCETPETTETNNPTPEEAPEAEQPEQSDDEQKSKTAECKKTNKNTVWDTTQNMCVPKKTGPCKKTIGKGEGTYDEYGVCKITKCTDSLYAEAPENNKCVLKSTQKIQSNIDDKKRENANKLMQNAINQMKEMKGKIKIGSVWSKFWSSNADNELQTEFKQLSAELAAECRKIPYYTITNSPNLVECECDKNHRPDGKGGCRLTEKEQTTKNMLDGLGDLQKSLVSTDTNRATVSN